MGHRVTLIPGDGTGPELTEATRRVLEATGVSFDWDVHQAGVEIREEGGNPLPQDTLDSVRDNGVALKRPITMPIGTGFRSVNFAASSGSTPASARVKRTPACARVTTTSIS